MRRLLLIMVLIPCIVFGEVPTYHATRAINAFAIDMYRELAAEGGNVFFSPYSISVALTMTYAGARGETATEMANTLRFAGFEAGIHASMRTIQDRFDGIPDEQGVIAIANRLWLDRREELLPDFSGTVERYYGAGVATVDFSGDTENARLNINDWVAQQTRDKIRDLLNQGDLDELTKLVLTNAIYFNSTWMYQFDKANTRDLPFYTGQNVYKNIPMMSRVSMYVYGEDRNMQWLKIPYNIPNVSMLVLLPRENETFTQLEDLESRLTPEALSRWITEMRPTGLNVQIPRFRDERRSSLRTVLSKLGMPLAFSDNADFTGMMDIDELYIDNVIHKAFIEVDEEGTEAAAATAAIMRQRGAMTEFIANKPFIYFIIDELTGVVLFMGRKVEV